MMQAAVAVLGCHGHGVVELLDRDLLLNLEVRKLFAQALDLDAQVFALLLAEAHLLLEHDAALERVIVLGLGVLERGHDDPFLALKVVV